MLNEQVLVFFLFLFSRRTCFTFKLLSLSYVINKEKEGVRCWSFILEGVCQGR